MSCESCESYESCDSCESYEPFVTCESYETCESGENYESCESCRNISPCLAVVVLTLTADRARAVSIRAAVSLAFPNIIAVTNLSGH